MAEAGSRRPANWASSTDNTRQIIGEDDPVLGGLGRIPYTKGSRITDKLREELQSKGLKGFKKGGNVKKTGVYKLHKGEKVIPANKVKSRNSRDVALLKKTRMPR